MGSIGAELNNLRNQKRDIVNRKRRPNKRERPDGDVNDASEDATDNIQEEEDQTQRHTIKYSKGDERRNKELTDSLFSELKEEEEVISEFKAKKIKTEVYYIQT